MTETPLQPRALLAALCRHDVDFVVIGGLAAVLHGSPYQTSDCDITPSPELLNLDRLSAALDELDARVWVDNDTALAFDHTGPSLRDVSVWNLVTKHGHLDITFSPAGTSGYEDLAANAVVVDIQGVEVAVASLADVIRSKAAAKRDKDHRTLPLLRRLLAEQQE